MMKTISKAGKDDQLFYDFVKRRYDTTDPTARRWFQPLNGKPLHYGMNNPYTLKENQDYTGRALLGLVAYLENTKSGKFSNPNNLRLSGVSIEDLRQVALNIKSGESGFWGNAEETVDDIGYFARLLNPLITTPKFRKDMYNLVYESLGAFSKNLVEEVDKGQAAVLFGKALVGIQLGYNYTKVYRDGDLPKSSKDRLWGKNLNVPESYYGNFACAGGGANMDCNGFMSDVLNLVGERYRTFYTSIDGYVNGNGLSQEDRSSVLNRDELIKSKRLPLLSYDEQMKLMEKINKPGVIMGFPRIRQVSVHFFL